MKRSTNTNDGVKKPRQTKLDELTVEQQSVVDAMLAKQSVQLSGPAGSGKSQVVAAVRKACGRGVRATGSTGIAACNVSGYTLHSFFSLKKDLLPLAEYYREFERNKRVQTRIRYMTHLVIDECSMIRGDLLEYVSDILKYAKGNDKPFGGVPLLLVGDYMQLPPVKYEEAKYPFVFDTPSYKELNPRIINLTRVFRQSNTRFVELLSRIRFGEFTDEDVELLLDREIPVPAEYGDNYVRLFSTNAQVDGLNSEKLKEIDSKEHTFKAKTKGGSQYTTFRFPEELKVKVGAYVMLLVNKVPKGLYNGSTGIVREIEETRVHVEFDNGVSLWVKSTVEESGTAKRVQIPLKLAWAITIHKSQGQQFERLYCDFDRMFAEGQAYTMLSRAVSLDGLFLENFDPESQVIVNDTCRNFYKK